MPIWYYDYMTYPFADEMSPAEIAQEIALENWERKYFADHGDEAFGSDAECPYCDATGDQDCDSKCPAWA